MFTTRRTDTLKNDQVPGLFFFLGALINFGRKKLTSNKKTEPQLELEEKIGEGSFGEVFKAKFDEESIAVKKSQHYDEVKPSEVQILEIVADGSCPYILDYLFFFTTRDDIFIGLELAHYGDLHTYMTMLPRTDENIYKFIIQISTALEYVHGKGIIHADLKPQNILVVKDPNDSVRYKIGDFGSAIPNTPILGPRCHEITTLWYRACELFYRIDPKKGIHMPSLDMWSLGAIIYELYFSKILLSEYSNQNLRNALLNKIGGPPPEFLEYSMLSDETKRNINKCPSYKPIDDKFKFMEFSIQTHKIRTILINLINYNYRNRFSAKDLRLFVSSSSF